MDKIQRPNRSSKLESRAPVSKLLAKEVDRKEFLRLLGFGSLSIAGIAPLIHFLTGKSSTSIKHIYENNGSSISYSRGRYNK